MGTPEAEIHQSEGNRQVKVVLAVARGEERQDSDVDFLVDMESDRNLLDRIL